MEVVLSFIVGAIQYLMSVPKVGPLLVVLLGAVSAISIAISCLSALMHSLIAFLDGMSKIKGFDALGALAAKLKVIDDRAEGVIHTYVLPILDRLSLIPLPQK